MSDDSKRNRPSGDSDPLFDFAEIFGNSGRSSSDSGRAGRNFFGAAKEHRRASADPPEDSGDARIVRYRVPCPNCQHVYTVDFEGVPQDEAYRFECGNCGEPFAWMPTESARLADEKQTDTANEDTASGFPVVGAAWWTGLSAGAAMALTHWPARILPDATFSPGSIRLLGEYFTHKEAVGLGLLALFLVGSWLLWMLKYEKPHTASYVRPLRALVVAPFFTYTICAISLMDWPAAAPALYAAVSTAIVWGSGGIVLGGALLVVAHRMRAAKARWSRRLVRTAVPLIVLGAMGLVTHMGAFSADPPLPRVQAYTAGRQLDAAREAAATASTEAERERVDEMFSEAGVSASQSGDLDRLEEALDAHIEFAEE